MNDQIPPQVTKYFWGDNLDELSWKKHRKYIIQTILDKGDMSAVEWLFNRADKNELAQMLPSLKLGQLSTNFWQVYLS